MRLDAQQRKLAAAFAFLFCIALGVLVFVASGHTEERRIQAMILSTSTPRESITSNGWWYSIPTDPSLPTMPAISVSTLTPTVTAVPSKTPTYTSTSMP